VYTLLFLILQYEQDILLWQAKIITIAWRHFQNENLPYIKFDIYSIEVYHYEKTFSFEKAQIQMRALRDDYRTFQPVVDYLRMAIWRVA